MSILSKIINPYVRYTTPDGNKGIKARTWHPAWFIPIIKILLKHWLNAPKRYQNYKNTLSIINLTITDDCSTDLAKVRTVVQLINDMDCGFECDYTEPYGFVPEAGCPIHDI